jgi:hypothetical protein
MLSAWRKWRQRRCLDRLAKELVDQGFEVDRPETLDAIIDRVRQRAAESGRPVREAEADIELLRDLAAMLREG